MSGDNKSKYVKLTHREHILKRPDSYIGSVESEESELFVVDKCNLSDIKIIKKKVINNPGFVKIFDEILSNASDHSIRTGKVKTIKIVIDDSKIIVENDGPTIDLVKHPGENIYIPEMIFSHLLTGENYDDEQERNLAGKNGYGSKLCNIYSKKFRVECCDGKQLYKQWTKNNMSIIEKPEITKVTPGTKSFTRITYYPDYALFNLDKLTEDLKSIIYKRCLDVAAFLPDVRISLDGKVLPIKKMQDYMKMHLPDDEEFFYEELPNGWKVGIAKSQGHSFEQVSVVNGVSTLTGTHTNLISLNLSKEIVGKFNKKIKVNWMDIKNKLFLFLICSINQPKFDTQTKVNLTSKMNPTQIGNTDFSENLIKKIMKSDIIKTVMDEIELRERMSLKKMSGGKKKIIKMDKLVDANKAGTNDSGKCHIFLCEGDSAVTMAISGMSEVGRDYYGAFPLKGKVLNVRGATTAKVKANEEIQNLINILGLEIGKKYETTDDLRYGKCVLMTDSDCVSEDTEILMSDNTTKQIKDINVGDKVKSHNGINDVIGKKESIKNEYVEITIEGNKFKFGLNHKIPVYDSEKGEICIKLAKDITKQDLIVKNAINV